MKVPDLGRLHGRSRNPRKDVSAAEIIPINNLHDTPNGATIDAPFRRAADGAQTCIVIKSSFNRESIHRLLRR